MPVTKTITLYQFDELQPKAREKARDWFRSISDFQPDFNDFTMICDALGVTLAAGRSEGVDVSWSGFSSQGDGASFTGTFNATGTAGAMIREHAPIDEKLHAIADALDKLAAENRNLSARITRDNGRYVHSMTMNAEAYSDGEWVGPDLDSAVQDQMRALADWLYRNLESEYDAENSADSVAENIRINEYTFREDGTREDA